MPALPSVFTRLGAICAGLSGPPSIRPMAAGPPWGAEGVGTIDAGFPATRLGLISRLRRNREHAIGLPMPRMIVITGASSGIGEALALRYASERARLGPLGRHRERLDRVAAECRRHGAGGHVAAIDGQGR